MKKLLVILMLFAPLGAFAQRPVETSMKWEGDELVLSATNTVAGNYSVVIKFIVQTGVETINDIFTVLAGSTEKELHRFRKTGNVDVRVNYEYYFYRGIVNPNKVNENFVYSLPFGTGQEKRGAKANYGGSAENFKKYENWSSTSFLMNKGDTVHAMRKGQVLWVVDGSDYDFSDGYIDKVKTDLHFIIVEHSDGTMARYNGLEPGSFMVNLGDVVYPGMPIALAGTDDKNGWLFITVYSIVSNSAKGMTPDFKDLKYVHINPLFRTSEGDVRITDSGIYRSATDEGLITKEMTNKEKKARQRKK